MSKNEDRILRELQYENLSSLEISKRTGISQPTVSRALKGLPVIKVGGGRSTAFALIDIDSTSQLQQVSESGRISNIGDLYIQPSGRTLLIYGSQSTCYDGIPYFLYDALPSGFLGQIALSSIVKNDFRLSAKSQDWTDSQILHYLTHYGQDLPGNFILGSEMATKTANQSYKSTGRDSYPEITRSINRSPDNLGSSVAGEQPKFTVFNGEELGHLIVKYSPLTSEDNPVAIRHRDLMVCEHLALEALLKNGIKASQSNLYVDDRYYLEVSRFDRVGVYGRKGIVSLKMIDAEYAGVNSSWNDISRKLLSNGTISDSDFNSIEIAYAFGLYIANTDMHNGNFSFFMSGTEIDGTTPIYDMLPMAFIPKQGEIVSRDIVIPRYVNVSSESNDIALEAALTFWQSVMEHDLISNDFKKQSKWILQEIELLSDSKVSFGR